MPPIPGGSSSCPIPGPWYTRAYSGARPIRAHGCSSSRRPQGAGEPRGARVTERGAHSHTFGQPFPVSARHKKHRSLWVCFLTAIAIPSPQDPTSSWSRAVLGHPTSLPPLQAGAPHGHLVTKYWADTVQRQERIKGRPNTPPTARGRPAGSALRAADPSRGILLPFTLHVAPKSVNRHPNVHCFLLSLFFLVAQPSRNKSDVGPHPQLTPRPAPRKRQILAGTTPTVRKANTFAHGGTSSARCSRNRRGRVGMAGKTLAPSAAPNAIAARCAPTSGSFARERPCAGLPCRQATSNGAVLAGEA